MGERGILDFSSNGDEEITHLKWESNSLTFEELIFLPLNHYGGGLNDVFSVDTEQKIGKMNSLKSIFLVLPIKMTRKNGASMPLPLAAPCSSRKLMPLDLLDLQGNEGLVAAAAAPVPDALLSQVQQAMQRSLFCGGGPVWLVVGHPLSGDE